MWTCGVTSKNGAFVSFFRWGRRRIEASYFYLYIERPKYWDFDSHPQK
jgi:hypothetical protein